METKPIRCPPVAAAPLFAQSFVHSVCLQLIDRPGAATDEPRNKSSFLQLSRRFPPTTTTPHIHRTQNGGKRSRVRLQRRRPGSARLRSSPVVHLRRQGRHAGRHLRPVVRCQGYGGQRGHALSDSLAAKGHHLRRAHQAAHHPDDDGEQGPADGQFDPAGAAPPGGAGAAQDLPGILSLSHFAS